VFIDRLESSSFICSLLNDVDSFYTQMSTDIVTILYDLAPLTVTTKHQISRNKFDISLEAALAKRNRRLIERRYGKHRTERNRILYRESCATAAVRHVL